MATITGFTAERMKEIEDTTVVNGELNAYNLTLVRRDGSTIPLGNIRGPAGPQGIPGTITASPAGGVLSGNYPNPGLSDGAVTEAKISDGIKNAAASTPSLRTLGSGATQAAPGNHSHAGLADTGWTNFTSLSGEAPFTASGAITSQYRKIGSLVYIRFQKVSNAGKDMTGRTTGDFPNVLVAGDGSIPAAVRTTGQPVFGSGEMNGSPISITTNRFGAIVWSGGFPRNYPSGSSLLVNFIYMLDD